MSCAGQGTPRNKLELMPRKIHSVSYGIETASSVNARFQNSLPSDIKKSLKPLNFSSQTPKIALPEAAIGNFGKIPPTNRAASSYDFLGV